MSTMKVYSAGFTLSGDPLYHISIGDAIYDSTKVVADVRAGTITIDGVEYNIVIDTDTGLPLGVTLVTDQNGNPVLDSDGNQEMEGLPTHCTDPDGVEFAITWFYDKDYTVEDLEAILTGLASMEEQTKAARAQLLAWIKEKLNLIIANKESFGPFDLVSLMAIIQANELMQTKFSYGFSFTDEDMTALDSTDPNLVNSLGAHFSMQWGTYAQKVEESVADKEAKDLMDDKIDVLQGVLDSIHQIRNSAAMTDVGVSNTVNSVMTALESTATSQGVSSFSDRLTSNTKINRSDWDFFLDENSNIVDMLHTSILPLLADIEIMKESAESINSIDTADKNVDYQISSIISAHADKIREIVKSGKLSANADLVTYSDGFRALLDSSTILKMSYDYGLTLNSLVLRNDDSGLMSSVSSYMKTNASKWESIVVAYEELLSIESNDSMAKYISVALGLTNDDGDHMNYDELMGAVGNVSADSTVANDVSAAITKRVQQLKLIMEPIVGTDNASGLVNALMDTASQLMSVLFGEPGYAVDENGDPVLDANGKKTIDAEASTGFIRIFVELGALLNGVDYVLEHISGGSRDKKLSKLLVSKVDTLVNKIASAI